MKAIPILEQRNGEIQLSESLQLAISNYIASFPWTKSNDSESISRNLKAQLLADSSGNWELTLFTDSASLVSKIVHS